MSDLEKGVYMWESATCFAKGDRNIGLSLEKRESNPKFNWGPKVRPKG